MTVTVGEKVERDGYCLAMIKIGDLAVARHRIPCGEWDYRFASDPRWRICVNGGTEQEWTPPDAMAVPRFHAYVECNGWPAGLINAAGGTLVGAIEDELIVALDREIESAGRAPAPEE